MKKITLFILLGILFNCQAKTSKVSKLCDVNLSLDAGAYAQHGKWTIVLSKFIENEGFTEKVYPVIQDQKGHATVPLELGDFNIVSLNFYDTNDLNPWQNNKQLFLKSDKDHISLSCFVEDYRLKIDSKYLGDSNSIAFTSFYEDLNEIMKGPGAYSRTGKDAETFAIRLIEFTNRFIDSHQSIDETLKEYLKIQGYNQSLFRNSRLVNSAVFKGDLYDLYDSELILFDNLSQIILKQQLDKNLPLNASSQIEVLKHNIDFTNRKITNSFAKQAILMRYLQDFRNRYTFDAENFQSDLKQFKVFTNNIKNDAQRSELESLFEKTSLMTSGAPFPTIELTDTKGNTIKSQSLFDGSKYVYIDIWASWCVPCVKEIPALKELEKEYANKNIKFVSISIDSKVEAWHKALRMYDLHGYQFQDQVNQISKILNIQGIPRFLFYDPKGNLLSIDAPRPSSPDIRTMINKHL